MRYSASALKLALTALFNVSNIDRLVLKNHFFIRFFDHDYVIQNVYKNRKTLYIDFENDKYVARLKPEFGQYETAMANTDFSLSYMLVNDSALVDRYNIKRYMEMDKKQKEDLEKQLALQKTIGSSVSNYFKNLIKKSSNTTETTDQTAKPNQENQENQVDEADEEKTLQSLHPT